MRVFASEYLSGGGAAPLSLPASLLREGRAMLLAFLEDLVQIPDCRPVTTWDARLGPFPVPNVEVHLISDDNEPECFRKLVAGCDAALAIAPEFDNLLQTRTAWIEATQTRNLGSNAAAVALCGDKLATAIRLQEQHVRTIPTATMAEQLTTLPTCDRWVVKPRCGAGSVDASIAQSPDALRQLTQDRDAWIAQPFIPGQPISVACLVEETGNAIALPVCEQSLDGLAYRGGRVPAACSDQQAQAARSTALAAVAACPGLRGFVGVDLILPQTDPTAPVVVEINPRLTTSYIGYRKILPTNLARMILDSSISDNTSLTAQRQVTFTPEGATTG